MEDNKRFRFRIIHVFLLLLIVIILSVFGAIIINELYKAGGGYITEWSASDVLAFFGAVLGAIGTIGLGCLTVWQNEKLREQNEKLQKDNADAQKRIESISKESNLISTRANELYLRTNELNIINKIIEHEEKRLNRIGEASIQFYELCMSGGIQLILESAQPKEYSKAIIEIQAKITASYAAVENSLSFDVKEDLDLKLAAIKVANAANDLMMAHCKHLTREVLEEKADALDELCTQFIKMENEYYDAFQRKLDSVIYSDMPLNEVRKMYSRLQEEQNGQAEDGE